MNKNYIIYIAVVGVLVVAGLIYYFFIFDNSQMETDLDAENTITENETVGNIKYEFTKKNVFSGLGDDSQNEAAEEDVAIQEAQELANPYAEIEEKANPFKSSYENPFE
ncbi:MAG: hypothetical protein KAV41_02005 [Candidatus Pacebacteria bacterium]|nr:hypothetical protein [Candidatus Paceibacterota bacterium]